MNKKIILISTFFLACFFAYAQNVGSSPEYIKAITSQWKGERSPDGRPRVSDDLLERLNKLPLEAAWSVLRNRGYQNQFEGEFTVLFPDKTMTGRAVTAQYMPIDILQNGDVYVADSYGKVADGPILGDNLANSIYAKSKRGIVVNGTARDPQGMKMIEGFNSWTKGLDPSFLQQMMLTSINAPIRIGRATVLPGDVVMAKSHGVLFIPAQLVEEVVMTAEVTQIRDEFGWARLKSGTYTPGQIDSQWSDEIKKDFLNFVNNYKGKLPMTREALDIYMKERNW
jgi:4-hydroxy-4-methyl-2-oxoglutarate aldolase